MDLVKYYKNKNRQIIRNMNAAAIVKTGDDEAKLINDAVDYFDRKNDIEQIREKMKMRFARSIKDEPAENADASTSGQYQYYARGKEAAAIDGDFYETISTGIGSQIAKTMASLFTADDQSWTYFSNDKESEETAKIISILREKGGFYSAIEAADFTACAINSAVLHVYWASDELNYDLVLPGNVRFVFGDTVIDSGISRPANKTKIEDATAVIIETESDNSNGSQSRSFIAYVGANVKYPDGRMVTYRAKNYWPIPDVGSENITSEYSHSSGGDPANPLTYLKNNGTGSTKWNWPIEYPISVIIGGVSTINRRRQITPISTTLYETCLELELEYSRLLKIAGDNARGKDVITLDTTADLALPKSLDIPVMKPGQQYDIKGRASKEALDAMEVLSIDVKAVASGYSVPGYMLIGAMTGQSVESGISLAIQTAPLNKMRDRRIKTNASAIARIFEIEKGLLAEYYSSNSPIPANTEQKWDAGTWAYPQPETERIAAITAARDAGYIDHIEAVRQYHNLASTAEAEAMIKTFAERDKDYESPFEETTPEPELITATVSPLEDEQ